MKKVDLFAVLCLVIIVAIPATAIHLLTLNTDSPSGLSVGRPMIVPASEIDGKDIYVSRIEFGTHYFVAVFDSIEALQAFAAIQR